VISSRTLSGDADCCGTELRREWLDHKSNPYKHCHSEANPCSALSVCTCGQSSASSALSSQARRRYPFQDLEPRCSHACPRVVRPLWKPVCARSSRSHLALCERRWCFRPVRCFPLHPPLRCAVLHRLGPLFLLLFGRTPDRDRSHPNPSRGHRLDSSTWSQGYSPGHKRDASPSTALDVTCRANPQLAHTHLILFFLRSHWSSFTLPVVPGCDGQNVDL